MPGGSMPPPRPQETPVPPSQMPNAPASEPSLYPLPEDCHPWEEPLFRALDKLEALEPPPEGAS